MSLLAQRRVDAAILLGAFPFKLIERLSRLGTPLLLLDSNLEDLPIDSITTDGFSAGRRVVEHLHQRGHRRIVMLAYDLEDYNIDMRTRGFLAALKDHGLPTKGSVMRNFTRDRDGLPILLKRLQAAAPPTAVVCVNDTMAVFMVQGVRAAGFAVPGEVSFVGYDDDTYARDCVPALTTVGVDKAELGRNGAEIIRRRIEHPDLPVSKARVAVQLIERSSVSTRPG